MIEAEALLALRDVTIAFGGVKAVNGVNFEVPAGAIVSLIGPNGAGKTTVLNSISGFVRARGSILFGTTDLLRLPAHRRAALGIGRTFQSVGLFREMSLLDNLVTAQHISLGGNVLLDVIRLPVLARERRARGEAMEILRLLGLDAYASRRAAGLPFGVQKLAGVARALALRPRLLLLDEPAAGLSRGEAEEFGATIERLRREFDLTVLLVEHNMRLVMGISDRIVVLDEGKKLVEGLPAEISGDPRVIEAYLGTVDDPTLLREVQDELPDGA